MLSFFVASVAIGQAEGKSPTAKFLDKRGYTFPGDSTDPERLAKWPDTLYYNTTYRAKLLGSPTIPISFNRVEFVDGKYQITPTIGIGYGYTWFFGHFIFSENDKIIVDPTFFFGLDVFTLSQKSLRPIGKVRELRRHKKIAVPISDE